MAQVPATPKLRRLMLRTWAKLIGPAALARSADLQASERAALNLRAAQAATAPENPTVVFLIPLVGQHHVGNWQEVKDRLSATLRSLISQTDPNWIAVICGQDAPDLPDDPRIRFQPFTTPIEGNDKWAKLRQLTENLAQYAAPSGYAMTFDADDLAHPELVAEMRSRKAAGGYLMTEGYVYDVGNTRIARAAPPSLATPLRKPFWKLCGSCCAYAFDLRQNPAEQIAFLTEATQHEHRMFPYLGALAGRTLTALSAPKALYMLNHGENFGARRGRVSFKQRFTQRFEITDPESLKEIRKDFALD
ncbi:MAG: hypothetical protein VX378_03105 [Pseudomonadota bacterium]|nr:hypothetical protein [Pseudomonadota bacterium]MEE3070065.1 hypothetical protein [Pseudomonadota bacterium]